MDPPLDQSQDQNQPQSTPKQQVVERVRAATNVLVTVRSNPTVDELAATIGLTLMLNKLGKHATAVFSGEVPSTLEFLKPEDTLESNTDSLRDFIVSLDKSKADKLRYKVEENVVKIFITPYRTSITQDDLEFTQGDFNVDVVLALGVTQREELDQAITAHGRILHDATVVTVTAGQRESTLGAINWQEQAASSLSEMLVSISEAFQGGLIDTQMATAFLTGIVAETERFSNTKTNPKVMTMAAQLMAAGANQQLIANELQKMQELPVDVPASVRDTEAPEAQPEASASDDGSLTIDHAKPPESEDDKQPVQPTEDQPAAEDNVPETPPTTTPESFLPPLPESEASNSFEPLIPAEGTDAEQSANQTPQPEEPPVPDMFASLDEPELPQASEPQGAENQIHIDEHGNLLKAERPMSPRHKVIEPLGDQAAAPAIDPQLADISALLQETSQAGEQSSQTAPDGVTPPTEASSPTVIQPGPDKTLLDIEESVHSPHLGLTEDPVKDEPAVVDSARDAVMEAIGQAGYDANRPEPRIDINAQPLGSPDQTPPASTPPEQNPASADMAPPTPVLNGIDPSAPLMPEQDSGLVSQVPGGMPLHTLGEVVSEDGNNLPPPPVPPPMMPQG